MTTRRGPAGGAASGCCAPGNPDAADPFERLSTCVALIEIEGEIKNATEAPVDVPNLMVVLRNDANQSVAEYVYAAPQPSLASGQTLVYRMTIENPPAEAQRAAITFTDRPVTP